MAEPRLYLRGRVWWTWVTDANGKREWISTKCRDKKAARERALDIERGFAENSGLRPKDRLTVFGALKDMLEEQIRKGRSLATQRASIYHVRHLVEHLGSTTFADSLTLAHTTTYAASRAAQGASKHTVHKELGALVQALKGAAKRDLWDPRRDPAMLLPELGKTYTPRDRWLTREEFGKLEATLAPNRRDYLRAWCYLGLRLSELYAVRPGDYDAASHRLRVRGTKTEGADRLVPVAGAVRETLDRRCRRPEPFPEWGKATRDLAAACARVGIPAVTPNDLRRTFASWLVQAGVPERVVAELLGHEDTTMVRAVYGHLDLTSMDEAVGKIGVTDT